MEETDLGAVARARSGDGDAFRVLVERHSRSVFRLAYRMTGNEQDAEDVVQETFLRAYRNLARFDERATFGTWLYRIASNYSLDVIRARKRTEEHHSSSETEQSAALDSARDQGPGPEGIVYGRQLREQLTAAMAELSPQERTAFVLRHFEGFSIEEIGATLSLADSAAKNSIFRAVRKLRRALEPLVSST